MTINKTRNLLYKMSRILGDIEATRKGKIGQRIRRRIAGKIAGRALRKIKK